MQHFPDNRDGFVALDGVLASLQFPATAFALFVLFGVVYVLTRSR